MSERRACSVIGTDRTSARYRSRRPDDAELRDRLKALAGERRRFGYRRLHVLLRREGHVVNRKKTKRLYREDRGGSENSPGDCFPDDAVGAQATGAEKGDRYPGAVADGGAAERALVGRPSPWASDQWRLHGSIHVFDPTV